MLWKKAVSKLSVLRRKLMARTEVDVVAEADAEAEVVAAVVEVAEVLMVPMVAIAPKLKVVVEKEDLEESLENPEPKVMNAQLPKVKVKEDLEKKVRVVAIEDPEDMVMVVKMPLALLNTMEKTVRMEPDVEDAEIANKEVAAEDSAVIANPRKKPLLSKEKLNPKARPLKPLSKRSSTLNPSQLKSKSLAFLSMTFSKPELPMLLSNLLLTKKSSPLPPTTLPLPRQEPLP